MLSYSSLAWVSWSGLCKVAEGWDHEEHNLPVDLGTRPSRREPARAGRADRKERGLESWPSRCRAQNVPPPHAPVLRIVGCEAFTRRTPLTVADAPTESRHVSPHGSPTELADS